MIALIYCLATLHSAKRICEISAEGNLCREVDNIIRRGPAPAFEASDDGVRVNGQTALPACYLSEYIRDLCRRNRHIHHTEEANNTGDLIEVYEARLKGPREIGWFVADLMLKLGLLGAIITRNSELIRVSYMLCGRADSEKRF